MCPLFVVRSHHKLRQLLIPTVEVRRAQTFGSGMHGQLFVHWTPVIDLLIPRLIICRTITKAKRSRLIAMAIWRLSPWSIPNVISFHVLPTSLSYCIFDVGHMSSDWPRRCKCWHDPSTVLLSTRYRNQDKTLAGNECFRFGALAAIDSSYSCNKWGLHSADLFISSTAPSYPAGKETIFRSDGTTFVIALVCPPPAFWTCLSCEGTVTASAMLGAISDCCRVLCRENGLAKSCQLGEWHCFCWWWCSTIRLLYSSWINDYCVWY